MDAQTLLILAAVALPVIALLYWWDYRTSGCAYGGSHQGKDNWLLVRLVKRIRKSREQWANREPRDVSDI